jgi:AMP nucleosidase
MHPTQSVRTPPGIATEAFSDAAVAVARLDDIYERNTRFLRDRFEAYANGEVFTTRVRATYPFVRVTTSTHARLDSRLSYGFVARPGVHETTVTRPDLFRAYLTEQIKLLIENHSVPVEIGESSEPIPVHFAYRRDINIEAVLSGGGKSMLEQPLRDLFDTPDLAAMDDAIANGTLQLPSGSPEPLALFRAARVDYSLHRLYHYTGTDPEHFQNFVIFTNYQFYVDAFARLCHERMGSAQPGFEAFVAPGDVIVHSARLGGGKTGIAPERMPQMPAFHLVEAAIEDSR